MAVVLGADPEFCFIGLAPVRIVARKSEGPVLGIDMPGNAHHEHHRRCSPSRSLTQSVIHLEIWVCGIDVDHLARRTEQRLEKPVQVRLKKTRSVAGGPAGSYAALIHRSGARR